jgi:hypothetical protein
MRIADIQSDYQASVGARAQALRGNSDAMRGDPG